MNKYKSIILNTDYNYIFSELDLYISKMQEDASIFFFVKTKYDMFGNVIYDFMDIINYATEKKLTYINTIIYTDDHNFNIDNVNYIVWFCKNKELMSFNKDLIREKHIWKDVEWGKRKKNYNEKGKDPGNVWIPTEDDGKGRITKHIVLSYKKIKERLIEMTKSNDSNLIIEKDCENGEFSFEKLENNEKIDNFQNKIIYDTSEKMMSIGNNTISVAITSPPYWNLKDYFKQGQIGQEDYEMYLNRLKKVFGEVFDKLRDNGSFWININIRVNKGKVINIPKDIINLCKAIGFNYKGIFIWHKSSGIPVNNKNIVDRHEYILIFSKSKKLMINGDKLLNYNDYQCNFINSGLIWNVNRKAGSIGKKYVHPAIYPNELVERIINLTTNESDLVLDPFLGSGTTLITSLNLKRKCIGYEYNDGFDNLIQSRINEEIKFNCEIIKEFKSI